LLKKIALPLSALSAFSTISIVGTLLSVSSMSHADEGQWQPYQLKQLKSELKKIGIAIPAEKLADLSKHPMSAIVSTGGCSASFVSNAGLIVTNHHCGYNAIQRNSTAENNLIVNGFLAKTRAEELPAGSGTNIYITDKVDNVTDQVTQGLSQTLTGGERHKIIQTRIKNIIAECEQDKSYRCSVPSFHRGLEYYRIRQMTIRDVRLVYAPSDKIGNYGGDIDNYEWPRHTGDFSFLRAYVGKDGRPADPSPDNVPYHSKDFLVVSAEGLKNGDPILLAGYPGRTSRYKLPAEIRFARDVDYPISAAERTADIATIEQATKGDANAEVRYASVVKSLNNRLKKTLGLLDGFARKDIAAIKDQQDQAFRTWLHKNKSAAEANALLKELDDVIAKDMALSQEEYAWSVATTSDLLKSAQSLYRLAIEKEKQNAERQSGFQERDLSTIKGRLNRLEQSFVTKVDIARYSAALQRYSKMAASSHPAGVDDLLPKSDVQSIAALYAASELADTTKRLAWMDKDKAAFLASNDAFIQLAVKLNDTDMALENRRKNLDGDLEKIIPQYMQAVIAWKNSLGKPVYPDANSTLRVTFGTVSAYSPKDGISKGPFTTVDGIVEKHTGKDPFIAPDNLIAAVKEKRYGAFKDKYLGTVPVNFLSSADTTGGNSGSAIMNKHGELIGLNFDSTYESIAKDWYFDTDITRAIHVDIRYMLWVMKELDGADNLLKEMTIKYPAASKKK
jgi:hypothetical protein